MEETKNFKKEFEEGIKKDNLFSIVYYGASTTSMEYCFPNWGEIIRYWLGDYIYENIGKYHWNLQTINRGLNGATSGELLERFPQMIEDVSPSLIFLNISKNDYYFKIPKKESEENTRKIIERSLRNGYKVVFTTFVPALTKNLNEKIKPYVDLDRKVAQEFVNNKDFMFIDFYNFFSEDDLKRSYTLISEGGNKVVGIAPGEVDPIHFNKYGNALVAKILLKEVFAIDFDHEKFIRDLADNSKKYPGF